MTFLDPTAIEIELEAKALRQPKPAPTAKPVDPDALTLMDYLQDALAFASVAAFGLGWPCLLMVAQSLVGGP